jgi:hypothetical protein
MLAMALSQAQSSEITVSGEGVALTFVDFFSDVSCTEAPIPKRTE